MEITPILLAAAAAFAIGATWYSPLLFLNPWLKALGRAKQDMRAFPWKQMLGMFVIQIVIAYVLSMVLAAMGAYSAYTGMEAAFWVWLGFVLATTISQEIFERRSWKLLIINTSYQLVALLAMGAILAVY